MKRSPPDSDIIGKKSEEIGAEVAVVENEESRSKPEAILYFVAPRQAALALRRDGMMMIHIMNEACSRGGEGEGERGGAAERNGTCGRFDVDGRERKDLISS